jgi:hypothetical protein
MTNLTNAEKYTPQFGFKPGVVVEIQDKGTDLKWLGYFIDVNDECIHVKVRDSAGKTLAFFIDHIKSIRLLTGTFAIWQFAPRGTVAIHFDKAGQNIQFCDALDPAPWEYDDDWMLAPWWHQPKETKNAKED